MGVWKLFSVPKLYNECLKKGHRPLLFQASFSCLYLYCHECQRIYRVDLRRGIIQYCSKNEWPGKPLEKYGLK